MLHIGYTVPLAHHFLLHKGSGKQPYNPEYYSIEWHLCSCSCYTPVRHVKGGHNKWYTLYSNYSHQFQNNAKQHYLKTEQSLSYNSCIMHAHTIMHATYHHACNIPSCMQHTIMHATYHSFGFFNSFFQSHQLVVD